MIRVRNLLAKLWEFCVYKVISSHSRNPKNRNISPKFSKLAKGGPDLSHDKAGVDILDYLAVQYSH